MTTNAQKIGVTYIPVRKNIIHIIANGISVTVLNIFRKNILINFRISNYTCAQVKIQFLHTNRYVCYDRKQDSINVFATEKQ
jgi:hypothetical protein